MTDSQSKNAGAHAKPFIKWVGGKSQLLSTFEKIYPKELKDGTIRHYCEPFLGGGAVFFDLAQRFDFESAHLFDVNKELILTYRVVQKDVHLMMEFLERYSKEYFALGSEKQKEYYYEFRTNYNHQRFQIDYKRYQESWIPRAAQLIFLNKTCFNGLYRVNQKGEFNTPSGVYKKHKPKILDEPNLLNSSKVLSRADLKDLNCSSLPEMELERSFIYFDPPYRPLNKTANFTTYSTNVFDDSRQIELAEVFKKMDERGHLVMLSNSDPKNEDKKDNFFDDLYADFSIKRVSASRVINSKGGKRGRINEILVTNF